MFVLSGIGAILTRPFTTVFSKKFPENLPFSKRIGIAEVTGKMLAEQIKERVMENACISLLGFSLGTRVMFACLKELAVNNIYVHDVFLLGGATPAAELLDDWKKCREVVAGRFVNCYSTKDLANGVIYRIVKQTTPIGSVPLIIEGTEIENIDVTDEAGMHTQYREHLDKVLVKIGFNVL